MEQQKKIKKQKAEQDKIQKAKCDAEKKLLAQQQKAKEGEAKAAVGLPSSDWTIIKLQLKGHLDVPIIKASDCPPQPWTSRPLSSCVRRHWTRS